MPADPHDASHHDDQTALDDLLAQVRAAGSRVTTARRAVLEVLLDAGTEHLSAEVVAERVHSSNPQVHLSTVYRTLDSLEAIGVLHQARLGAGPASYHLHTDVHHHALCTSCGAVIELPPSLLAPIRHALRRDHGFTANPQHLTIPGRCRDCEREEAGGPQMT